MERALQLAWAAGFFDGEGCVSLHLHSKAPGQQYPMVQIILVQKDRRPIEYFHAIFGARERVGITRRGPQKRPYYRLTYGGQNAARVLTDLLPYLTLKRDVAEVALDVDGGLWSAVGGVRKKN